LPSTKSWLKPGFFVYFRLNEIHGRGGKEPAATGERVKERAERVNRFAHNLGRELGCQEFFLLFARNPLKSPDSKKQMKANESYFAFINLHLLAGNSLSGCIRGLNSWPRAVPRQASRLAYSSSSLSQ
jgi:hypothetical protein